jgi:hypothetical protein
MMDSHQLERTYYAQLLAQPHMMALKVKCELQIQKQFTPRKIVDVMLDDTDTVPNADEMEALRKAIRWMFARYYPKRLWRKQAYIRFDDNCYGGA